MFKKFLLLLLCCCYFQPVAHSRGDNTSRIYRLNTAYNCDAAFEGKYIDKLALNDCLAQVNNTLRKELDTLRTQYRDLLQSRIDEDFASYQVHKNIVNLEKVILATDTLIPAFCQMQGWEVSSGSLFATATLTCEAGLLEIEISKMEELIYVMTAPDNLEEQFQHTLTPIEFCRNRCPYDKFFEYIRDCSDLYESSQ